MVAVDPVDRRPVGDPLDGRRGRRTVCRLISRGSHTAAEIPQPVSENGRISPGCAGIYTAHAAIELYAAAFEEAAALDKLEAFASVFGARFYGLPLNAGTITLERAEWRVPERLAFGSEELVPLRAGETVPWKLA